MRCPFCSNNETKVVDKRPTINEEIRRRRECLKCNKRFTTYESIQKLDIIVLKKDGRKEKFFRDKLKQGMLKACEKRPVSEEQIEQVVNKIESELRRLKTKEIPSKSLGEKVIKKLKSLDEVAYLRFASVYKSFEDIKDFEKEVKALKMRWDNWN